jgi:hypothetical protein
MSEDARRVGNIGAERGRARALVTELCSNMYWGKKGGEGRISMHFPGQARAARARQCTCYPRIHVILRLYPFMARRTPPASFGHKRSMRLIALGCQPTTYLILPLHSSIACACIRTQCASSLSHTLASGTVHIAWALLFFIF